MQHPSPHTLRQQPRKKRRNSTPRTPQRTNTRQRTHLQASRNEFRKHARSARIDRTEQESDNGDGDRFADYIWDEPDEELECCCAGDEEEGGALLADAVRGVGEEEAA